MTDHASSDLDDQAPLRLSVRRPGRRTVLTGAAWAAPVAALSVGAPAVAASGVPTLRFDQPSYDIQGCGDLSGIIVRGTTDGSTPLPQGTPITVTLPEGFTAADGSENPLTVLAGPDGSAELPDIIAPISATTAVIEARYGGVVATAELEVSAFGGGQQLYAGAQSSAPNFRPVLMDGLPDGSSFTSLTMTDGALYATLGDGRVFTAREGSFTPNTKEWYDTGLTGDVHDWIISSSSVAGNSLVLHDGQLTSFVASPDTDASSVVVASPLPSPPGTPVDIATVNGVGSYYVETSDGKIWVTPFSGAQRGTWTQITGFPAPAVDWIVQEGNNSEILAIIGADGNLYSHSGSSGIRPSVVRDFRNPFATWVAPLQKFAKPHQAHDAYNNGVRTAFVDANGDLFIMNGGQNRNLGGVLAGRLGELEVLLSRDSLGRKGGTQVYVLDGDRLYMADLQYNTPFKDITPSEAILDGESVVEFHSGAGGVNGFTFAVGSGDSVWLSDRMYSAAIPPNWKPASGVPESFTVEPIIQDAKWLYLLAEPTECPTA